MTKEEHAKVLDALEAITKHFGISRLHESTLADTTVRGQAHEAIAIMRKEPEPQPCPNGEPCKHAGWCTEVYCQGIPVFRNQYKPEGWQPIETAPKDGTAIMLGARWGAWIGKYLPIYQSGYKPENPWSSLMLNHDHLSEKRYSPTHWMPLPTPPGKEPEPISDARNFPHNTCPASRHAEIIGKALVNGKPYPMLTEEPEHCGESILSVVQSLYAARTKLALLEKAQ